MNTLIHAKRNRFTKFNANFDFNNKETIGITIDFTIKLADLNTEDNSSTLAETTVAISSPDADFSIHFTMETILEVDPSAKQRDDFEEACRAVVIEDASKQFDLVLKDMGRPSIPLKLPETQHS